MYNFGIAGVGGFVAPRHLKAIKDTGNNLVIALDPHDSVGILDTYFPDTIFFTQTESFKRCIETIQNTSKEDKDRIHFISICTPNYLHDSHIQLALKSGANAICEKPLTTDPRNIEKLINLEYKTNKRVFTVLQLRLHPTLLALKQASNLQPGKRKTNVILTYITRRGKWYQSSWKASVEKSGGLAMNIGIHFFDMLIWLFGPVQRSLLQLSKPDKMAGVLELEKASVRWFLSIDNGDLPNFYIQTGRSAYRALTIDGEDINFSDGFTDLHTRVYEEILNGRGSGIEDARPSLELVDQINRSELSIFTDKNAHPFLMK